MKFQSLFAFLFYNFLKNKWKGEKVLIDRNPTEKISKVVKRNERGIEVEKVECEGISKNKNESFPKS